MKIVLDENLSRLITGIVLKNPLPEDLLRDIAFSLSNDLNIECRVATDNDHHIGVLTDDGFNSELTFMNELLASEVIVKTVLNSEHHATIKDDTLCKLTRRIADRLSDEEKIIYIDAVSNGEFSQCAKLIASK